MTNSLAGIASSSLKEYGYRTLEDSTETEFRFHLRTSSGSDWRSQLQVYEELSVSVLLSFLTDREYPIQRQDEVYELASLTNESIVFGSIVTRLDDGAILFRNAMDWRQVPLSADGMNRFMNNAGFPISLWEKAYQKLLDNRGPPLACLTSAMIELNAVESKLVNGDARRATFRILSGHNNNPTPRESASSCAPLDTILRELRLC